MTASLGVVLPASAGRDEVRRITRTAIDIGASSIWVPEGFADNQLDALAAVAAIASDGGGLEVGAYMLNASVRDHPLTTRMVRTLETLAPGRIRVVLGTGWDRSEYEALGLEFPSPDQRTARTAELLSLLKRETTASVEIAGVTDELLELVASGADGWSLTADAVDAFFERFAVLKRACDDRGRRLEELRIACALPSLDLAGDRVAALVNQGLNEVLITAMDAQRWSHEHGSCHGGNEVLRWKEGK